ncbi:amino acid adenylation domain-containing protein [Pseudonocardia nematodicida]|uniref:Amino acid adenylation domain-containing protein n=1 Tax=Pseudonocardia nematodicida TaxID=1206997 RepID=A0ABV1KEG4_9PSEU
MKNSSHDVHELSAHQRDIWVAAARDPHHPQFTVVVAEQLDGPVDVAQLLRCARERLRYTDALCLQVGEGGGEPVQWVDRDAATVQVHSSPVDSGEPGEDADQWAAAAAERTFVLGDGPLAEVVVLTAGPDRCILGVAAHHIVADTRALVLFTDAVLADYAGRGPEREGRSYLESVADDVAYRSSEAHGRDRAALAGELADAVPALFARGSKSPGERCRFVLDAMLVSRMLALGESPFSFVAAGVAAHLSRVHNVGEVVLGVPLANRPGCDSATVGQFANTLPLRVWTDGERTLRALASEIRASTSFLREHGRTALGDLVRELGPSAGPRIPFDVTVSSMRHPSPVTLPDVRRLTAHRASAHRQDALAIHMHAFEGRDEIEVHLHFGDGVADSDLIAAAMTSHLETLLRAGIEQPLMPMGRLTMTDAGERERLIGFATGPDVAHPAERTLTALIEQCVDAAPSARAVVGTDPLTRVELDGRANQVARGLRARGVRRGDRVAVLLERGPELLPAVFGVLKAGAAYVPVDPAHPPERIRFVLSDCGARVVLTGADTSYTPENAVPVADLLHGSRERLGPLAGAADLAYVIYTSGTTGRPKGAMIEHRSVVNRLGWMQRDYPIDSDDVLLQKTPISFDVSVWELFWWAVDGAAVSVPPAGTQRDPHLLLDAVERAGCTVLHFVPSMLEPFLSAVETCPDGRTRVASLRTVFCSGEALPPARVEQCARVLGPHVQVVNLYGPTEACVDVSHHDCTTVPGSTPQQVPIGRPVDNTSLFVLDPYGNLQPAGVPGELCIAGRQLARGYLDRPELTEEKFVGCTFAPGGRIYRTGDLARWTGDGELLFLGRLDDQVKIRGNRVELGEVGDAVRHLPDVRDAVVVDRTTAERGTHLVAYVIPQAEPDPARYRAGLAARLPDYMIPSQFVPVEQIPLTVNGKTDRRALPSPETATVSAGAAAPSGPVETALADAWARVLGTGPVGAHDDFFLLGGDSLLMLRVRAEAAAAGVHFSLTDLLRQPTVAALAAIARPESTDGAPVQPFELVSRVDRARLSGVEDAFPAPRLALGMLFHSDRSAETEHYRDVFRYSLRMPWAEREFRLAVDALVRRHPGMRASFDLASFSEPLQLIHPSVPPVVDVTDLRGHPDADAEAEINRHVAERRNYRYAVDQPPLYHLRVFVRDGAVELVVSFHHAVFDGGSVANLVAELFLDYRHALGEPVAPVTTSELPSPAEHVRAERAASGSEADRQYWAGVLDGAPRTRVEALALAFPPSTRTHFSRTVELDEALADAIRALAAEHGVPVKSVLLGAHALVLGLLTGQKEVVTGLVTHCRPERRHADRMIGLFLNTVPVRLPVDGTALETVVAALQQEREGHPHRRYPLSAVQSDHGATRVFDTAFNYVHFHVLQSLHNGDRVRLERFRTWERTEFALLVNAFTDPGHGGISLRLDYDGDLFATEQAELVEITWRSVLRSLTARPHRSAEGAEVAPAPRTAPAAYPAETVVRGLEDQVQAAPDTPAIVDGERTWSYARLDRAARAVARGLIAAGVRPGAAVGVTVGRSPELVAVVVGTALAGAACLPLDPSYPQARIAIMLDRARPDAIVVSDAEAPAGTDCPTLHLADLLSTPDVPGTVLPGPSAQDPAYVLFTSGSTGEPKGVVMPHRALANLVCWQNSRDSGAVGGRTLQFAPMSFDVSFQEVWSTLCGGGTLVLIDDGLRRDPGGLLRLLDAARVERVFLPYVALEQLADAAALLEIVPSALRVVVSSGEQLRISGSVRALCAALPSLVLENQYGPTETHVVCAHPLSGDPDDIPALPPIGHPVDGTEVRVLDRHGRSAPAGTRGEIHVGGICLADGYVGRPDLTSERFIAHPTRPDERLYRTGDAGLALADGTVIYLGRLDDQVKVRGYRVEPAEVELALRRVAGRIARDVAVVAVSGDGADARLVAFLVAAPGGPTEGTEALDGIRRGLRAELPEHLVPAHLQWIEAIPATSSGKRDDAALRALPLAGPADRAPVAPRDETERVLVAMAGELLHRDDLGVDDDLFAAGATSLTAMRLVVLIEQRFGVAVPLATFAAAPTIADVATVLRDGLAEAEYDPLVPLRIGGDGPPLFLVHPMGGNVLCYLPLVRHLPPGFPVYGLQAAGTEPGSEPADSVERIAAAYIAALRRVRTRGPYRLAGWSFGGFVAFEMARVLRADGEDVSELVLIDSIAPDRHGQRTAADPDALMRWFFWELLWLRHGSDATVTDFPVDMDEHGLFEHLAALAVDAGVLPPGSTGVLIRRLFAVFRAHWTALDSYRPPATDQDLTLLHATGPLPPVLEPLHASLETQHTDPTNGWNEWTCGRLDVVDVDGDHLDLMEEPHVRHVADVLARLLSPAEASR